MSRWEFVGWLLLGLFGAVCIAAAIVVPWEVWP